MCRAIGHQEVPLWGGNPPGKLTRLDMGSLPPTPSPQHMNLCLPCPQQSAAARTTYTDTACRFLVSDQLSDEAGRAIQLRHPFLWKDVFPLAIPKRKIDQLGRSLNNIVRGASMSPLNSTPHILQVWCHFFPENPYAPALPSFGTRERVGWENGR